MTSRTDIRFGGQARASTLRDVADLSDVDRIVLLAALVDSIDDGLGVELRASLNEKAESRRKERAK